jgi:hypothetical protein
MFLDTSMAKDREQEVCQTSQTVFGALYLHSCGEQYHPTIETFETRGLSV